MILDSYGNDGNGHKSPELRTRLSLFISKSRKPILKIREFVLVLFAITFHCLGCSEPPTKVVDSPSANKAPTAEEIEKANAEMSAAMSSGQ